jgi:GT2 family glycosyltransferase
VTIPTPRVSVVVPNWNGARHLPELIETLGTQTYTDFELIVVDNASTDSSVWWLENNAPHAHVVRRAVNGGVSACVNSGIRVTRGEYIVVLMNDTAPDPCWLGALIGALEETSYDAAASRLVFYDTPDVINAAGDTFVMSWFIGAQRGRGESSEGYLDRVRVLGACGGAAAYRRSFFDDVGLFDEDFFMVHEDTDLNLRALIAGKRCVYVPEAVIRHKDSATVRLVPELLRLTQRNQFVVIGKDMPAVLLPYVAVMWVWRSLRQTFPLRPSMWSRIPRLMREGGSRFAAQVEGFRMGWPKRKAVWGRRVAPMREIVRWLFNGIGPV